MSRRNLLYVFGVAYATPLLRADPAPSRPCRCRETWRKSFRLQFPAVRPKRHGLPAGGSIWLPRDIPHCWANAGTTNGKLILLCQPGGFEKFFDEAAQGPPLTSQDAADLHKLHLLHAKYGMELLGPPLFPPP
jgi:hypothetical protein